MASVPIGEKSAGLRSEGVLGFGMQLWLLKRAEFEHDEMAACVVRAPTADQAREIAADQRQTPHAIRDESEDEWLIHATCELLGHDGRDGEPCMICADVLEG